MRGSPGIVASIYYLVSVVIKRIKLLNCLSTLITLIHGSNAEGALPLDPRLILPPFRLASTLAPCSRSGTAWSRSDPSGGDRSDPSGRYRDSGKQTKLAIIGAFFTTF